MICGLWTADSDEQQPPRAFSAARLVVTHSFTQIPADGGPSCCLTEICSSGFVVFTQLGPADKTDLFICES